MTLAENIAALRDHYVSTTDPLEMLKIEDKIRTLTQLQQEAPSVS